MPKPKKLYFFVIGKEHFYTVSSSDLITAASADQVKVGDQIAFNYGKRKVTRTGTVQLISSKFCEFCK